LRGGRSRGVLLLHGFGDSPFTLRYLADDLFAHGYDVRAPLLPGHGQSFSAFDSTPHTAWVASARAELMAMRAKYPWVALCGLSMGGALATILASEVRDLPRLVLLAPYLGMPWHIRMATMFAPLWSEYVGAISSDAPESIRDPDERMLCRGQSKAHGAVTGRVMRELARVSRWASRVLPDVTSPTLLIQSSEDNRVSRQTAERSFAALGSAEKRLLFTTGAGHVITVDYGRERVFEEVRAWLGGGPGTEPPEPDVTNG
jgi:carboxylesterase